MYVVVLPSHCRMWQFLMTILSLCTENTQLYVDQGTKNRTESSHVHVTLASNRYYSCDSSVSIHLRIRRPLEMLIHLPNPVCHSCCKLIRPSRKLPTVYQLSCSWRRMLKTAAMTTCAGERVWDHPCNKSVGRAPRWARPMPSCNDTVACTANDPDITTHRIILAIAMYSPSQFALESNCWSKCLLIATSYIRFGLRFRPHTDRPPNSRTHYRAIIWRRKNYAATEICIGLHLSENLRRARYASASPTDHRHKRTDGTDWSLCASSAYGRAEASKLVQAWKNV